MKYKIFTALALAGSALAELFGGWDQALQTLVIFMAVDWITGGILLPAVFRKSPKAGLMGMPLPEAVRKGIDVLKSTSESGVSGYGKP